MATSKRQWCRLTVLILLVLASVCSASPLWKDAAQHDARDVLERDIAVVPTVLHDALDRESTHPHRRQAIAVEPQQVADPEAAQLHVKKHPVELRVLVKTKPGHRLEDIIEELVPREELSEFHITKGGRFEIHQVQLSHTAGAPVPHLVAILSAHPGVVFAEADSHMQRHRSATGSLRKLLQDLDRGLGVAAGPGTVDAPEASYVVRPERAILKPPTAAEGLVFTAPAPAGPAVSSNASTTDPLWPAQWDKRMIGLTSRGRGYPGAWARSNGSQEVIVAVIDGGVDITHPDLQENIWTNEGELAGDGQDNDGNGYVDDVHGWNPQNKSGNVSDADGHGTHCSGIIGAVANNAAGIAGVSSRIKIMPCVLADIDNVVAMSAAIACIEFAIVNGAHITSNSYGFGSPKSVKNSAAFRAAIAEAEAAGQLFVESAGNESNDNDVVPLIPSTFTSDIILAVASTEYDDTISTFSNYGRKSVDLAAPGGSIISTVPGERYWLMSGTSMACPNAAGAAALLLSIYGAAGANITGRGLEIKKILMATVQPKAGWGRLFVSGGRLDVGRAVLAIPEDLSVFESNPNAPLPYDLSLLPDATPQIDYRKDLFFSTAQPIRPDQAGLMRGGARTQQLKITQAFDGKAVAKSGTWFNESGRLSDSDSLLDCECSSCLGPEKTYRFSVDAPPSGLPAFYALTISAEPASQLVISAFRNTTADDKALFILPNASSTASVATASTSTLPARSVVAFQGCGAQSGAKVTIPIASGAPYLAIVDGIGGYDGEFSVDMSGQPLAKPISWANISSPSGLTLQGSFPQDSFNIKTCHCPALDCGIYDSVFYTFVAEESANLELMSSPYDSEKFSGVTVAGGDMCIFSGGSAFVGPCAAMRDLIGSTLDDFDLNANDSSITSALFSFACSALQPVYNSAKLNSTRVQQLKVEKGKTYYVAAHATSYAGPFRLTVKAAIPLRQRAGVKEVPWRAITAAPTSSGQTGGYGDTGRLNESSLQSLPCSCHPGLCNGPEAVYSFVAGANAFVSVATGPYYYATNLVARYEPRGIDLSSEPYCMAPYRCYEGAFPSIFKEEANGSVTEVTCGFTAISNRNSNAGTVFTDFLVQNGTRYFVVVDGIKTPGISSAVAAATDTPIAPYYDGAYSVNIFFDGTPTDLAQTICALPFTNERSASTVQRDAQLSSYVYGRDLGCPVLANGSTAMGYEKWYSYRPPANGAVQINVCQSRGDNLLLQASISQQATAGGALVPVNCTSAAPAPGTTATPRTCLKPMVVNLNATSTYYIVVDSFDYTGAGHAICITPLTQTLAGPAAGRQTCSSTDALPGSVQKQLESTVCKGQPLSATK